MWVAGRGGIPSECRVNTMSALFTDFLCVHALIEDILGVVCASALVVAASVCGGLDESLVSAG